MSTSVRRHAAKVLLAFSLLGGAALAANNDLLSPTADGGLPGPIIDPGGPTVPGIPGWPGKPPRTPITPPPINVAEPVNVAN